MTTTLPRTQAEQALIAEFDASHASLPGARSSVRTARRRAIDRFAADGLPHRRLEQWKYTDLRERLREVPPSAPDPAPLPSRSAVEAALGPLARVDALRIVLVGGSLAPALSDLAVIERGVHIAGLADWLERAPDGAGAAAALPAARDAIDALNGAFVRDGVLIRTDAGARIGRPLMIVNVAGPGGGTITARHAVEVAAGSSLALVEVDVALDAGAGVLRNTVTEITVGRGADLRHTRAVVGGSRTTQLAQLHASLAEGARYRTFQLTAGIGLARNETHVGFTGPDAKLDVSGAFLGRGSDHIDTTLVVDHTTTGCESRELFKGVLDGRARGVFQGKIVVRPEAQKTDGKQMAQALMLSEDAEFDSKPELEIYADDVVCGHGSTAAELDPAMVFYLRSRGIPKDAARAMLIESFVAEAIEKVEDETLRTALMEIAVGWLRSTGQAALHSRP